METRKIDWLNIGLILLALLAAFWLPFGLFLFSYAILGPLHYLTELNWLQERSYFCSAKSAPWILGVFVGLICLGSFFMEGARNSHLSGFRHIMETSFAAGFFQWLTTGALVHLAFWAFAIAVALTAFSGWWLRGLVVALALALAYFFKDNNTYILLVGSMLPTFIHVCVFTGLFMLYGAMKAGSRPGYGAFAVFIAAHLAIAFWPIDATAYFIPAAGDTSERFVQSGFHNVIYQLALVTGWTSVGGNFAINSELGVRLAIFLAFAYTYHYLNWFSKTSIIGWHQVPRKKLIMAGVIWLVSVGLYAYDYRLGLLALLFLSLLHVVFEFPLNYISIAGIGSFLFQKTLRPIFSGRSSA